MQLRLPLTEEVFPPRVAVGVVFENCDCGGATIWWAVLILGKAEADLEKVFAGSLQVERSRRTRPRLSLRSRPAGYTPADDAVLWNRLH
ncbi:unnamed protein product [Phytomonas sp. EM1]|nr:unnamed protein product [Phytomonas sp. EM1]|eukprot:CCW64926.1 unnamed protein product [Phytomonas sp. isolate EM1]